MAEILKFEKAQAEVRPIGGFVMTATATDIRRTLNTVRSIYGTAMTYISGGTGIGKTEALIRFCQQLKGQVDFPFGDEGSGQSLRSGNIAVGLGLGISRQASP